MCDPSWYLMNDSDVSKVFFLFLSWNQIDIYYTANINLPCFLFLFFFFGWNQISKQDFLFLFFFRRGATGRVGKYSAAHPCSTTWCTFAAMSRTTTTGKPWATTDGASGTFFTTSKSPRTTSTLTSFETVSHRALQSTLVDYGHGDEIFY